LNVPAIIKPKSVLIDMSDRYGMEPAAFEATVRATCMPPDKNGRVPSREEFAAFLLVAKEYDLNPITKQIYAFSSKGGGIVPIVSVDGWLNLVNSHPQCDGFDFEPGYDEKGELFSYTCTMHRKDRKHPTAVTEYLSECIRPTEPWKMRHRMLRHKSMIQAARYAFGFAGIYDEDEGRTIAEAVDVTPKAPLRVPSPSETETPATIDEAIERRMDDARAPPKDDPITSGPQPNRYLLPNISADYDAWFNAVGVKIGDISDPGELEGFWNAEVEKHRGTQAVFPSDYDDLLAAYDKRQAALNSDE
jgi:phage recombination protein Bet